MLMAASGLHAFFIPSNSHKHSVSTVYAATDKDEPKDQDYRKYDSEYENLRCGSMKDLHPQSFKEKERDQLHYMEREWDTDQNRCRLWEKETVKEQEREKKRVRASDADKIEKERIHARKAVDREPGELSSGSLSEDGGGMSDYDVNLYSNQHAADGEVQKPACGSSTPKQRKYSPIVWDLDDKPVQSKSADVPGSSMVGVDASKMSAEKMSLNRRIIGSPLHSAEWVSPLFYPSLPPSPSLTSPFSEMWQGSQDASVACQMPLRSVGGRLSRPFGLEGSASLSSPPEQHHKVLLTGAGGNAKIENTDVQMQEYPGSPVLGDEQESQQLQDKTESNEKEEALLPRHIAASRWADLNNSPEHASFLEDEGILKVWKHSISVDSKDSMVFSQSGGNQGSGLIMSPEPAEHASERLEHGQGRSRTDNGECKDSGGSSVREFQHTLVEEEEDDQKLNHNKLMELDEEDDAQNHSHKQHPELDSDGEQSPTTQSSSSPSPQRIIDMLQGCRSVDEYERLNRIDEGTYGVVYRARNKKTGEIVALKKVKMDRDKEEFPMTSLREINVLLSFHHPSVVDVKEVVVGSNLDSIFMVMEYMEHDLKALLETMKHPFSESEVKCLMLQLLEGVKYLHDNWVLHRDLKTSNLLLNNKGELKICDFGLARQYGSPLKPYTNTVVTLWYRAPELLLGAKQYSTAIDMWSVGCIMAELLAKGPLFNGKSEITQLDKIFRTLGTPNEKIWPNIVTLPGVKFNFSKHPYNNLREKFPLTSFSGKPTLSESGFDLLNRLLTYDPRKRVTAEEALKHKWFSEVPLPKSKDFMPTYPARNDHDRRKMRLLKSPDPLEEQRIRELQQGDLGTTSLFG